jgi:hypothetical protein
LAAEFEANILAAKAPVIFTREELEGVSDNFLSSPGIKIDDDRYQVMADSMWQYNTIEENAWSEATRKKLYVAHDSLAKAKNVPVVNQMLALRNQIALQLGYKSWADYQAEIRMAKTAANAQAYIDKLITEIQPKFDAELRELQQMKTADTNDPNAKLAIGIGAITRTSSPNKNSPSIKKRCEISFPFSKRLMACSRSSAACSVCVSRRSSRRSNGRTICGFTSFPTRRATARTVSCISICSRATEKPVVAANPRS